MCNSPDAEQILSLCHVLLILNNIICFLVFFLKIIHSPNHLGALFSNKWSEEACAAHLTQRDGYQATTQGQLKEQLYQEIIHYFDKGKVIRECAPDNIPTPRFLFSVFVIHHRKHVDEILLRLYCLHKI